MATTMNQSSLELPENKSEKVLKKVALYATTLFFIFTGLRHLLFPDFYYILMPSFFPVPVFLIYFTGVYQIVCALGLLTLKTRKLAAQGLMLFLLLTLPLLVFMWTYKHPAPSMDVLSWFKLLSVPMQFALIFWVYLFAQRPESY